MRKLILEFLGAKSGATSIEYAFIASLIAVACVAAMGIVGTSLTTKFTSVANDLAN
ncbi:Flp family type IVb pilin [Rhodoblastus acidophilus]|uniref:Flp family type IVb pilin n=1 Tax=Candidatus Rhodoblastus alkanivorans TaxID=2954117 RepID=A0ABS9Z8V4_9HYPH|nr:Flp family type IVb pilin [Candidatus Rhodoblastus alkanivorans]MCI4678653.1 Flp family type IVb pilin [Candidatus Rhodoblastus alkanivorans]MCI4683062.1 Flp family type IVb pilin [Candidatus Rhodoblastus alkanivorans]